MIIDVPDKDIFFLSLDYKPTTSLFWEYFSDIVCSYVNSDDLEQCIKKFEEVLLQNE